MAQPAICGMAAGSSARWISRASSCSRACRASRRREATPSAISRLTTSTSVASSQGFWTKLFAPRRMASTAVSMLPQPVMTTTGSVASWLRTRSSSSRPSRPEVVSRV